MARLTLLAILVLTLWAYWGSVTNPFQFDDHLFLSSDQVTDPESLWRILSPTQGRQLTYLTFFLNFQLGGTTPAGYHVVNLLLHLANVVGVFFLCKLVHQGPRATHEPATGDMIPFGAAMIFALHPVQSEAVNYVYQRSTLLAALFSIVSLWFFVSSKKARSPRLYLAVAVGSYLLAVAGKEAALILPLCLVAYMWTDAKDWSSLRSSMRRDRWFLLPLGLFMIASSAWILYWLYRAGETTAGVGAGTSPFQYLVTETQVILTYLRLLIWPTGLSVDHDYPVASLTSIYTWFCIIFLLGLLALALRLRQKKPAEAFFLLLFFVLLAPTSSLVPSADLMFEHRLYLPMIGAAPMLAWGGLQIARLVVRRVRWQTPAWTALMCVLAAGYAAGSRHRTHIWGDGVRLWQEAAARAPRKARPHYNLGVALMTTDREKAREAFLRAVTLRPDHTAALYNLGWLEQTSGRLDSARKYYDATIQSDPAHWQAHHNLGNIHVLQGRMQEAMEEFEETIRLRGEYWPAHQSLGTLLVQQGRYGEAVQTFTRLKQLQPDLLDPYYLMARALFGEGRFAEAEEELRLLARKDEHGVFMQRIEELRRTYASWPR